MSILKRSNLQAPPAELAPYLESVLADSGQRIRCRAMLAADHADKWHLVSCAFEAFPDPTKRPAPVHSRTYPRCLLFEDWLDLDDCRSFIVEVQSGKLVFGSTEIVRSASTTLWELESVMLDNLYMPAPGLIVRTRFEQNVYLSMDPLISFNSPYYPDEAEAANDWLGRGNDHRYASGRNGEIVFLLPESRAYFSSFRSENGMLHIDLGGTKRCVSGLRIIGAYWDQYGIQHFSIDATDGQAAAQVPDQVTRLECILINATGTVFDRYFEHLGGSSGLSRHRVVEECDRLRKLVLTAMRSGESEAVEFKPFVDLNESLGTTHKKTKYRELVQSIVAFANARGGRMLLGIDDHCNPIATAEEFSKIAKSEATPESLRAYAGALLNKFKGDVDGEIGIQISSIVLDDHRFVAVVEVPQADRKPLMVRGDKHLYLRVGASNKQVPANEWPDYFLPQFGTLEN